MHVRSLGHFTFDSVLAPYNYSMMSQPGYAADFDKLENLCSQRQVALQTIKSVARRRWTGENGKRFSWYEPIKDGEAIRHNVQWVLARPGVFLNTSSDGTLLPCGAVCSPLAGWADHSTEPRTHRRSIGICQDVER